MGVLPSVADADRSSPRLPRLPRHLLVRPDLIARLDDDSPLTIVSGVQGYGKTTLLANWAWDRAGSGLPTVWLRAAGELNSAEAFDHALQQAWRDVVGDRPLVSAPSRSTPWSGRADVPSDVVIVIDDFQAIDDEQVIRDLLELPRWNRGLRIVVSTRRHHSIERLAADEVEMRVILSRELLLSPEEIVELSRIVGRPIGTDDADRLHEAVGGWVSAVRIVLELFREGSALPLAAVRDYLRTKVYPAVRDREVLGELMRFSLPDVLDAAMVRDLSRGADPDELLEAIERPGLFERRYVLDSVELHLPSLVQQILREKFQSVAPDEAREAHREFALWFERSGGESDLISAFEHAVQAQDWPLLFRLWQDHAGLFFVSFPQRFHQALLAIPENIVANERGAPVTFQSLSIFAGGIAEGVDGTAAWFRAYALASSRALAEGSDHVSLHNFLHFAPGKLIALRGQGLFNEAGAFAMRASSIVAARLAKGEIPGDRLCWFYLQVGLTHRILGDEIAAIPAYELAWEHGARSRIKLVEANAAASLALMYAYRSDQRRARLWLDRRRQTPTAGHWLDHLVAPPERLAAALLALDALDGEGCRAQLAELEDATASLDAWQTIAYVSAQYALHFGDADAALAALSEAEQAHPPRREGEERAFVLLSRARADLLLATGRVNEAMTMTTSQPDNLLLAVPRARAHLLVGEYQEARLVVSAGLWNVRRRTRDRLEMLLIDAVCALKLDEPEAMRTGVRRAVRLLRETGNVRALTTISRADLDELLRLADCELAPGERAALDASPSAYPERLRPITLTDRERSLLRALEAGDTRKEMAEMLFLSINTVKTQLATLYEKLGVTSKAEALRKAHLLKLV